MIGFHRIVIEYDPDVRGAGPDRGTGILDDVGGRRVTEDDLVP
jgi:hypothetical protein